MFRPVSHRGNLKFLFQTPHFSDNSRFAVGTVDGEIYIWKTCDLTIDKKYKNFTSRINTLVYSPDGQKIAVGTDNGIFCILEVTTGKNSLY